MKKISKNTKVYAALTLIALGIGAGWFYQFHSSSDSNNANNGPEKSQHSGKDMPVSVGVATAKTGDIDVYLNGLGNVTPRSTVTVHTRVDGQLMHINFTEGQLVKSGSLLAELDARPYQAQLKEAEGQLMRDQALLNEAKIDLKRYQTLFEQDSIAKQQLDTQSSLVKQYEGAVKNDQGLVEAAKVQIIYTRITSPVSGRVGLRQVDAGNIVHAADANGIVVVTELQPITAIFTIPEDNIPAVMAHIQNKEKLAAEAWDRDNKNQLANGVLTAIDNQVDPTTGTVKFRAEFPNLDNKLFPSQFINIKLRLETKKNAVLIPAASVQHGKSGAFVYLVQDDKTVKVQNVTLGVSENDLVLVEQGLKAGDILVIDGSDNLRDGSRVIADKTDAKLDGKTDKKTDGKVDNKSSDNSEHKNKNTTKSN